MDEGSVDVDKMGVCDGSSDTEICDSAMEPVPLAADEL